MKNGDHSSVAEVSGSRVGSTSMSLLVGLRGDCPDAWRRLADLYTPLMQQWCLRKRIPPTDIDDVIQEVMLAVTSGIKRFRRDRDTDTFRGWLRRITDYKVADWIARRTRERGAASLDVIPVSWTAPEDDEQVEKESVIGLYTRALDLVREQFEEKTWKAFWNVTVEDRDPGDVAKDLHMSRSSVYVAKSRVLRRLREVMGDV
jgi:RNA polymerase sigma-70 factor, ECF subfamily